MNSITVCDVNFDVHSGPIAVSVSGGADSAILLYMIMKYCPGPISVYTCSSRKKNWATTPIAYNVILKCMTLTNRLDVTHHTFFVEEQTYQALFSPLSIEIERNNYQIMYTAVTAIPPATENHYFTKDSQVSQKRDPNVKRPFYNGPNKKYYSPFFNVDKRKIRELYEHYGLLDQLFPLTRSCESLTLTTGHCGQCWWCEERKWAFGRYQ